MFELRHSYRSIFPEDRFIPHDDDAAQDTSKVYKVSYKINMLPCLGEYVVDDELRGKLLINEELNIMDMCIESDQLDIFESKNF